MWNNFTELDLSSYEDASANWFKIIREDALLNWWLSLDKINEEFETIHKAISHTPIVRKFPALTKIPFLWWVFNSNIWTKLQWFEWKLSNIFIAYDDNYNSLIKSGELYTSHINSISHKIDELDKHLTTVPLTTDDNKLYAHSVENLIASLTGTKTRMIINLDTAEQIRIQMKLNKPIFKTIIDSLVIEKTWEIWLKAAQNSIDTMNKFIHKASVEMTDNTIAFSKEINANKYDSTSSDIFQKNIEKLHWAMQEIATIKQKAIAEYNSKKALDNQQWISYHHNKIIPNETKA